MNELSVESATAYLAGWGYRASSVAELPGGVSNIVLRAETDRGPVVLKQSLGRLRVEAEWLCDRGRIFREVDALRTLEAAVPEGSLPRVLFEDRDCFTFAMTAAPDGAVSWKAHLLEGRCEDANAVRAGALLAAMVRASWCSAASASRFGDQTVFEALRTDPYYRTVAAAHPEVAPRIDGLIAEMKGRRLALVHGDWSPKNFLVAPGCLMAIDFEVIHFGDPAFDVAFVLNHLLLKSFHRPESRRGYTRLALLLWQTYVADLPEECPWMEAAVLRHLGALLLARVDGKSPAEYLRNLEVRDAVRRHALGLIHEPPAALESVFRD